MVELKTSYTLSGIPYISYDALDDYAEKIIAEFAPEFLNDPGIIDAEAFIEYYLNLQMLYHRICYDRKVMGMTAFNSGFLKVINEETGYSEPIKVTRGTVILDTSLTSTRNLARLRFTTIHEGAHWILHQRAFAEDNPMGKMGIYENQYLAAKEGETDYSRSQNISTEYQRLERQADFFAAAILMPRPALRTAFCDFFKFYGEKPRIIKRRKSTADDLYAIMLPEYIAKVFGVSKSAALIRLEKLSAIVNCENFRMRS